MRAEVKQYLKRHLDDIDEFKFDYLYTNFEDIGSIHELTDALLSVGIDPLPHLNVIPAHYLRNTKLDISNIKIPNNITAIEANAFAHTNIEQLIIPEGCTIILKGIASGCPNLREVWFPSTLSTIHAFQFTGCNQLERINYNGTRTQWEQIHKYDKWLCFGRLDNMVKLIFNDGTMEWI